MLDTTKIIKSQRQQKNLFKILTSSISGENTTQRNIQALNTRISLHRSNIKITENRKIKSIETPIPIVVKVNLK